jgi:hypothetical protein
LLHLNVVRRGRRMWWWYERWKGSGNRYSGKKRGFRLRCGGHGFLGFWPGFTVRGDSDLK